MWIKAISEQTGLSKIFNLCEDYAIHWENISGKWYLFINHKEHQQSICLFAERDDEIFNFIITDIFNQIVYDGIIKIESTLHKLESKIHNLKKDNQ